MGVVELAHRQFFSVLYRTKELDLEAFLEERILDGNEICVVANVSPLPQKPMTMNNAPTADWLVIWRKDEKQNRSRSNPG
jgi:hypothetical protein